jgi:hypothetical protein
MAALLQVLREARDLPDKNQLPFMSKKELLSRHYDAKG